MAKDLAVIGSPRSLSIINVSLALCPTANTRHSQSIQVSSLTQMDVSRPFSVRISVSLDSKRTSPPRVIISSRIALTIWHSTSVPIWGLFTYRISGAAPNSTKSSSTFRCLPKGSFTKVFNFPSEKVPAPPSPN